MSKSIHSMFLSLWDTGKSEEIRKGIYSRADAIMVCFPVKGGDEENYDMLKNFFEESWDFCKKIILVGTKTDERSGKNEAIPFKEGIALAKKLNGQTYLECSAQNNDRSVEEVFKEVAKRASVGKGLLADIR